jgi:hypothetical protein
MTEPRAKKDKDAGNLSEGAKNTFRLISTSPQSTAGKPRSRTATSTKFNVEEDSITLYSRVKKTFFKKNDKHLDNEFIKGTPICSPVWRSKQRHNH